MAESRGQKREDAYRRKSTSMKAAEVVTNANLVPASWIIWWICTRDLHLFSHEPRIPYILKVRNLVKPRNTELSLIVKGLLRHPTLNQASILLPDFKTFCMTATSCTCLSFALQTSEQLAHVEASYSPISTPPDQVMKIAHKASDVCQQYAHCTNCCDPSSFPLYAMLLSKAATCYSLLLHSQTHDCSPENASISSGSSGEGLRMMSIVRIGAFEVETQLDEQTRAAILRAEVRRAAESATLLDAIVNPSSSGSLKGGVLESSGIDDPGIVQYHLSLVTAVRSEFADLERRLLEI